MAKGANKVQKSAAGNASNPAAQASDTDANAPNKAASVMPSFELTDSEKEPIGPYVVLPLYLHCPMRNLIRIF